MDIVAIGRAGMGITGILWLLEGTLDKKCQEGSVLKLAPWERRIRRNPIHTNNPVLHSDCSSHPLAMFILLIKVWVAIHYPKFTCPLLTGEDSMKPKVMKPAAVLTGVCLYTLEQGLEG